VRLCERDAATTELARYLKERKTGRPDDWVAQIAGFLTGDLAEADLLKAAESTDAKTDRERKFQACFYAGSRRLIEGDKAAAKDLFQKGIDTGFKAVEYPGAMEYLSALAELKALSSGK
jgi:lipoprotein NlpI